MKNPDLLLSNIKEIHFNNLETDFKAEVVAKGLLQNAIPFNQLMARRLANNSRSFNKDVKALTLSHFDWDENAVVIETYKDSIYDYLPEGMVHKPNLGSMKNGIENIILEIRRQKEAENNSRAFFQPFEMESFYTLLAATIEESNYDNCNKKNKNIEVIGSLWPLLHSLHPDTAQIFIYLLPFFHQVRGNKAWFEKCMIAFLQLNVTVTFEPNIVDSIEDDDSLLLSNMLLGISSILNGKHTDGERNWIVNIGPIPYTSLKDYLPESKFRSLLKEIYSYCLPATAIVFENFITEKETTSFVLPLGNEDKNFLGFSTFL